MSWREWKAMADKVGMLPCPFCGHPEVDVYDDSVWCKECNAATVVGSAQVEDSIAAWNSRAPGWMPIETAPIKQVVLVCGGDLREVEMAQCDPGRYTPWSESHHVPPPIASWYLRTSRGSGKIWPAPTHWMPLPVPAKESHHD